MIWISPHFDDAVLSCGEQIAADPDATVVTVLGGSPGERPVTAYDVRCGFANGDEAVSARNLEDLRACTVLGARHVSLRHLDGQYGAPLSSRAIRADLRALLGDQETICGPLGLAHEDHVAVSNAVLGVAMDAKRRLFLWEDLPSRVVWPEMVAQRMEVLHGAFGVTFYDRHPAYDGGQLTDIKEAAIRCYRSQTQPQVGLPWRAALVPERIWEVTWQ